VYREKWNRPTKDGLSLSTDGLVDDRILSKYVINISLRYVILFYVIGFTDRIFLSLRPIIYDSWPFDFHECFYSSRVEGGSEYGYEKVTIFS